MNSEFEEKSKIKAILSYGDGPNDNQKPEVIIQEKLIDGLMSMFPLTNNEDFKLTSYGNRLDLYVVDKKGIKHTITYTRENKKFSNCFSQLINMFKLKNRSLAKSESIAKCLNKIKGSYIPLEQANLRYDFKDRDKDK